MLCLNAFNAFKEADVFKNLFRLIYNEGPIYDKADKPLFVLQGLSFSF